MSDLFLKIINMSISASWLVLVVLLLRFVFKKAPKWASVLLWGIVAVRLIFPFSIESALSLIPSAETISPNIMMDNTPSVRTGIPAINSVINPVIESSFAPDSGASVNPLQIWIPVLSVIWVVGVAALILYTAISYWRLRRKVSEAVILRDNIYQSENVGSPFVLGIIKPKIYLSYNMGERDLSHVIAHERVHIRRKDHWWKPIGFLLLAIHWFNPLMWLAYVLLCRDIELACDEKVIKELGNEQRADYTQALVACSVNRRVIAACPLAFGEVGVKDRVKSVMNYKKPAFWVIVVAIIACAVVAICFLTNPVGEEHPDDSYYLLIGADGVESVEISLPGLSGGAMNADGSPFKQGAKVWLEQLQEVTDLRGLKIVALGTDGEVMYALSVPENATNTEIINIVGGDGWLVAPTDFADEIGLTPATGINELIPGTAYVSWQCLYMNPLSSYGASSDSGYRYILGDDHFIMINRGSGDVSAITSDPDIAVEDLGEYPQNRISVTDWKWQEFPYTDEEWNDLYKPGTTSFGIYNPNEMYGEILYRPITDNLFLLRVDGALWIVELKDNPQMGTYLWSIYSLIPESAMGVAQWEYAPMLSSRLPVFRFEFDMEYTEISAACENGLLSDWDAQGSPRYEHSMTFHAPDALYWAPITEDRRVVGESAIHFTALKSDGTQTNGTIYLTSSGRNDGRYVYTASLVGAGMYLSPNTELEGAIISESIAAQMDIPAKTETIFKLNLAGNTSMQQTVEITDEMPYWGLNVVNTGEHSIIIELDGTVYEVEAGKTAYIHADKPWEAGSYPISFASVHGMEGSVVCETAPEQLKGDKAVLVLHDLTTGKLEISSDGAEDYVFYTNSKQICITVRSETEFQGEITLIDVSQDNAEIQFAEVSSKKDKAEFTGLTSARRYRIKCDGLDDCILTISG